MDSFYRMKISLGRVTVELESHDKQWLEEKEKTLLGTLLSDPSSVAKLIDKSDNTKSGAGIDTSDSTLTINEFQRKYIAPKNFSRPTIALFLVYFLEKLKQADSISTNDVRDAFKSIAYPKYNTINYTDVLNQLKSKGYLNKIDGNWRLTITGIDYILSEIPSE